MRSFRASTMPSTREWKRIRTWRRLVVSTQWKPVKQANATLLSHWMRLRLDCVKPVKLIHEAETELWEAALYYEEQQGGLGSEFIREVRTGLQMIQRAPEMWPARAR